LEHTRTYGTDTYIKDRMRFKSRQ